MLGAVGAGGGIGGHSHGSTQLVCKLVAGRYVLQGAPHRQPLRDARWMCSAAGAAGDATPASSQRQQQQQQPSPPPAAASSSSSQRTSASHDRRRSHSSRRRHHDSSSKPKRLSTGAAGVLTLELDAVKTQRVLLRLLSPAVIPVLEPSNVVAAFGAIARVLPWDQRGTQLPQVVEKRIAAPLALRASAMVENLSAPQLVAVLSAMGTLNWKSRGLMAAIAARLPKLTRRMAAEHVSASLWACSRLKVHSEALLLSLQARALETAGSASGQAVSQLAWALTQLRLPRSNLHAVVENRMAQTAGDMNPHELSQSAKALAQLTRLPYARRTLTQRKLIDVLCKRCVAEAAKFTPQVPPAFAVSSPLPSPATVTISFQSF